MVEPPSRSTLLKILKLAPAAKAHELRAINSTLEACKQAFARLQEIVSKLIPIGVLKGHFTRGQFESLVSYLHTAERYYRNAFVYNLQEHSNIRSHCVTFSLSDPKTKMFAKKCMESDHMEKCENCQILPDSIQILRNIVEVLYNNKDLTNFDFNEYVYDIHDAHVKINDYIRHMLRNHQSNNYWKAMMDRQIDGDVFVIFDFAMKFLPRVNFFTF